MEKKWPFSLHRIYRVLIYASICLFAYGLVRYSRQTAESACQGLELCASVLIPSLFPFFVLSSLAVSTGLAGYIGRALEKPMRLLFRVPGACAPAFALGLVGGYPVGAKTAIALYEQKLCTKTEAERLLSFCNNSGPAFILGIAGASVFASTRAGILLYVCHILASILVGLVFRFYGRRQPGSQGRGRLAVRCQSFGPALAESVRSSAASIVNICAFVVFFTVAIRLLNVMGVLPAAASLLGALLSPLGLDPAYAQRIISGILELTTGIWSLTGAGGPLSARLAIAAFMLGWAGLSVHCQVLSFLHESGLSVAPYIGGKVLHGLLSAALTWFAAAFLPFGLPASAGLSLHVAGLTTLRFGPALACSFLACTAIWLAFLFLAWLARGKKHCQKEGKPV